MPWDPVGLVAELNDALPMLFTPVAGGGGDALTLLVHDGVHEFVTMALTVDRGAVTLTVAPLGKGQLGCDPTQAAAVLVVVSRRAGGATLRRVVLHTTDPIFRDRARRLGFAGELRGSLARAAWEQPAGNAGRDEGREPSPDGLAASLSELLPHLHVKARRTDGAARQFLSVLTTGVTGVSEFDIVAAPSDRPLRLQVIAAPGLLTENVARAIDTIMAVRHAFGPAASHIRHLSFAATDHSFRSGRVAGQAAVMVARIEINQAYADADALLALRRQRLERSPSRAPAHVPPPFSRVDGVVAHECWHHIESAFNAGRYGDSIRFRGEIGRYLGVDTLEHAVLGNEKGAPTDRRHAFARLSAEVSAYATTNPGEATAELFELWWCTRERPPPIAAFFGDLLHRFFGVEA